MKNLNEKVKVGDKVKVTIEIEIEVLDVFNNSIEGDFLDILEPSITSGSYNDICIFQECIKSIKKLTL